MHALLQPIAGGSCLRMSPSCPSPFEATSLPPSLPQLTVHPYVVSQPVQPVDQLVHADRPAGIHIQLTKQSGQPLNQLLWWVEEGGGRAAAGLSGRSVGE